MFLKKKKKKRCVTSENSGFYTKVELSGVFDWINILSENSNYLKENFSNKI